MLRKMMKIVKNLVVVGLVLALLWLCMECNKALFATICCAMVAIICAAIVVVVATWICERNAAIESGYPNLYKFYQMMRYRLTLLGYDHEAIIPCGRFLSYLNYRLVYSYNIGEITSIDIANAIMHTVVSLDDDDEFVFDVFTCVKHMLSNPKVYEIVVKDDRAFLEVLKDDKMQKANVDQFIWEYGKENMMVWLRSMQENSREMTDRNLWEIYEKITY